MYYQTLKKMKRYLILLNTILVIFVFCSTFLLFPDEKVAYACGGILGVTMTGGVLTIDSIIMKVDSRDWGWISKRFFSKSYMREAILDAILAITMYVFSLLLLHPLFTFFLGFMLTILVFILTEWVYKVLILDSNT